MMLTITKTKELVDALVKIRGILTDEQAFEVMTIFPEWKAGANVASGERIVFAGALYRVLKDHIAEDLLAPDTEEAYELYELIEKE